MTRPVDIPIISKEPVTSVLRILALEEVGKNLFRAHSLPQVCRTYGGQVIVQTLIAAAAAMDRSRLLHSFHTYFTRGGTPSLPFELRVERLRGGRSFSLRRIVCPQEDREILTLQASYRGSEDSLIFTSETPKTTPPEELPSAFEIFRTIDYPIDRFLGRTTTFGVCHVQRSLYTKADGNPSNRQQLQMRPRATIPQGADQHVYRALLAHIVDQIMLEPAMRVLGLSWATPGMSAASFDHVMWFHRDIDINEWLLFGGEYTSVNNGRTLVTTRVFTRNGVLLAEVIQQEMLRVPSHGRKGSGRWGFGVDPETGASQLGFA